MNRLTRRRVLALGGAALLGGVTGRVGSRSPASGGEPTIHAYVVSYHWGFVVLDDQGRELDAIEIRRGSDLRLTVVNVEAEAAVDALPQPVRDGIPDEADRERRNEASIPVPSGVDLAARHELAEDDYPDHSLAIAPDELWTVGPGPGQGPGGGGPGQGPGGGGPGQGPGGGGPGQGPGGQPGGGPGRGPGMGPGGQPGSGQGPGGQFGPGGGLGPHGPGHHVPGGGDHMGPGFGGQGGAGPAGPGGMGGMGVGWTEALLAPPVWLWHHATVPTTFGFAVEKRGSFTFVCTVYCGYGHPYMVRHGALVASET